MGKDYFKTVNEVVDDYYGRYYDNGYKITDEDFRRAEVFFRNADARTEENPTAPKGQKAQIGRSNPPFIL